MESPNLCACEYFLIRLMPDPIRGEQVNIGVALYQPSAGGFIGVRINSDPRRARGLSPEFDFADLAGLEQDLLLRLQCSSPPWLAREYFLQLAQETFSHSLQFSPPAAVLTPDPPSELDRLYRQYAAPAEPRQREADAAPRRHMLRHLRRVFDEERVLGRLGLNLRAGTLTAEPDPFRFDFHYQAEARHHLIQAVPLGGEDAGVKALCFTVDRLRARLPGLDAAAFCGPPRAGLDDAAAADFQRRLLQSSGMRLLALEQAAEEAARIRAALGIG